MRINCIANPSFGMPKRTFVNENVEKNGINGRQKISNLQKYSKKNVAFGNRPWVLHPSYFGVPEYGNISGPQAVVLYEQLKKGNYLDIGDDKFDFDNCNRIREYNLSFLDRLVGEDKRYFINHYKRLTGFPDLQQVSNNIKNEFVKAVEKSEKDLYYDKYKVLLAGYDGVCSVARGKAFPGSDLDKAYVIIKGTGNPYDDIESVNQFKGRIWENTDQRLLSYNHDDAAFPQVYTKNQIEKLTEAVDKKDAPHRRLQIIHQYRSDIDGKQFMILERWTGATPMYSDDYVAANPYWVEYTKQFPRMYDDVVRVDNPSRENIKNLGFTLEAIREGKILKGTSKSLDLAWIPFESTNLSQLAALKDRKDKKPKRLARDMLSLEFPKWDLDKQFRFIKTLIKSACANNREFTKEFANYFSKPGQDMFASLIKALLG